MNPTTNLPLVDISEPERTESAHEVLLKHTTNVSNVTANAIRTAFDEYEELRVNIAQYIAQQQNAAPQPPPEDQKPVVLEAKQILRDVDSSLLVIGDAVTGIRQRIAEVVRAIENGKLELL